jgi:hypothetical protein
MPNYTASRKVLLSRALHPLATKLIEYWRLDEASGSRAAAISNANDLTDVNTVTSTTGLVYPTVASFDAASSEALTLADNAVISTGDIDWCWAAWVNLATTPASVMQILAKNNAASTEKEYTLYWTNATSRFRCNVSGNGTSFSTNLDANTLGAPSTATWYLVWFYHDSINNFVGIAANAGAADTLSYSSGTRDGTGSFSVGATNVPSLYWNGQIGPMAWWKNYIPTLTDRTWYYNNGIGRTFEALRSYRG